MADMHISSDHGLQWGNVTITPEELAFYIKGISIQNGLLVLDGVKFWHDGDDSYIADYEGKRFNVLELHTRIEQNGNVGYRQ